MCRVFLIIFSVLTLGSQAMAIEYVSGTIEGDTTWYLTDSPYVVTGDVTVSFGVTLP